MTVERPGPAGVPDARIMTLSLRSGFWVLLTDLFHEVTKATPFGLLDWTGLWVSSPCIITLKLLYWIMH